MVHDFALIWFIVHDWKLLALARTFLQFSPALRSQIFKVSYPSSSVSSMPCFPALTLLAIIFLINRSFQFSLLTQKFFGDIGIYLFPPLPGHGKQYGRLSDNDKLELFCHKILLQAYIDSFLIWSETALQY